MNYKLTPSDIIFIDSSHTYLFGDRELQGITGMLSRQLFPKQYENIPEMVLKRAAERGSKVHNDCRTFDMFGIIETDEVSMYAELKKQHNIETIDNEYLVSDNEYFASAIDVVATVNGELSLCDIKTTSKLNKDYVSWQLSIYKYLFELQNPDLEVKRLYAIHIRDKAELIEVDIIDKEIIKDLLNAEINEEQFINPFQTSLPETLPNSEQVLMLETAIIALKNEIKEYEEEKELMLSTLESEMERIGLDSWETDAMKITRVKPTVSNTFDSKTFQSDNPETYEKYIKQTTRKGYIKITLK